MATLNTHDVSWCVRRLPDDVARLMKKQGPAIFLAGGYIRSVIAREDVNDIDLFSPTVDAARANANAIHEGRAGSKFVETGNAFTVTGKLPVQFIHRWTFEHPQPVIASFDFTIAGAVIWFENGAWCSLADDRFYEDLAAKRLVYSAPERHEDAGGSLLRVLKFYQRGYRIPLDSLSAVITRLVSGLDRGATDDVLAASILVKLREVDPAIDPTHVAHLPAEESAA